MILDSTTKSIELILGSAVTTNAMPITVDYVEMTTTTTVAGSSDTQSNGVTAVTILSAPATSTQRKVNSLSVFNADTAAKVTTIRLNNNTTLRTIVTITLQVGDTLGYTDTAGWYVLDSVGQTKLIVSNIVSSITIGAGGFLKTDGSTATATAGAATLNKMSGKITTESLTTAGGGDYILTITNSEIAAADLVFAEVSNGTNTGGEPLVEVINPAAGSVSIEVHNNSTLTAFNGTLKLSFLVVKQ